MQFIHFPGGHIDSSFLRRSLSTLPEFRCRWHLQVGCVNSHPWPVDPGRWITQPEARPFYHSCRLSFVFPLPTEKATSLLVLLPHAEIARARTCFVHSGASSAPTCQHIELPPTAFIIMNCRYFSSFSCSALRRIMVPVTKMRDQLHFRGVLTLHRLKAPCHGCSNAKSLIAFKRITG